MTEDLKLYIGGVWAEGAGDAVHELISPPAASTVLVPAALGFQRSAEAWPPRVRATVASTALPLVQSPGPLEE